MYLNKVNILSLRKNVLILLKINSKMKMNLLVIKNSFKVDTQQQGLTYQSIRSAHTFEGWYSANDDVNLNLESYQYQ